MKFLASTIGKVVAALIVVVLILGVLQVRSCQQARQQAAQSKVDRGQGEAGIEAGAEAGNTVSNVMEADQRVDQTVRGGRDEILSQPAGQSNAAAIRAACRMRSHCGDRRCAELSAADPAVAACRRAVGAAP